jgi:AcrR family transcriptional regulator
MDDDVSAEIMAATYRALCEHGYADLTMRDIADETGKSKATLHYHYDSKRSLLLAFLDYLYESFAERIADPAGETPSERLASLVDAALAPPDADEDARVAFGTAVLELKAQAPYDEAVRDRLRAFDEILFEHVRDIVVAGVESGAFRPVDPDDTARFVVTAIDGARTEQVALGRDVDCTRRMLRTYVGTYLSADGESDADDSGRTDDREVAE